MWRVGCFWGAHGGERSVGIGLGRGGNGDGSSENIKTVWFEPENRIGKDPCPYFRRNGIIESPFAGVEKILDKHSVRLPKKSDGGENCEQNPGGSEHESSTLQPIIHDSPDTT